MILGNVTISNGQSNQTAQGNQEQQFRGRGRGHGRGSFFRGRGNGNFQSQAGRGQQYDVSGPAAPAHSAVRGSTHPRYNRQTNPSPATADGFQANQALTDKRRAPRVPKHLVPPNGTEETEAFVGQPPRILQRPHQSNPSPSHAPHHSPNPHQQPRQYGPRPQHLNQPMENPLFQVHHLDQLALQEIPKVEITMPELEEKEAFRNYLEELCQKALSENYTGDIATISLVGFGSLASGFATPGSDMDLAVVPGWKDSSKAHEVDIDQEIPRLLEKAVLDAHMGARLLTRTRVPILKVCQKPSDELFQALSEERRKWDELSEEEKYAPPAPPPERTPRTPTDVDGKKGAQVHNFKEFPTLGEVMAEVTTKQVQGSGKAASPTTSSSTRDGDAKEKSKSENANSKQQHQRNDKPWLREKTQGPLDFPKSGVGIQCDINFGNPLGIHNTQLLRCYSFSDPRVRPMVLFVKAWAKRRKINSSYSGTLSSYGWVLMVLHYLVNVAQPPVCPNLQSHWRPPATNTDIQGLEHMFKDNMISGYGVRFWRNEEEILHASRSGQLTRNNMSIGALLRGFFQYYASITQPYTYGPRPPTFYWTNEVLSLRTPGGVRMKSEKGWTGAKTTISNGKEVRNRYLFCIEDPFEIDHNVARTVTHHGIVAIRDEFRRAWRILSAVGKGQQPEGGIFDEIVDQPPPPPPTPKQLQVQIRDGDERLVAPTEHVVGDAEAGTKVDGQPEQTSKSSSADMTN
jgi:terminal uridylyltransferase